MIKLIIFDWDDVFTRGSIKGYYKCYHEALLGVGVTLDPEEENRRIKARWGKGHVEQLRELLRERPELVDSAIRIYEEHFFGDTFVDCLTIIPGSQLFLTDIAKRYTLAVATGLHPKILKERLMPAFHIPNVFSDIKSIYDLDDPEHAKPHPFMAKEIMKHTGVMPDETVLVGDAASDMQMAWSAGAEPIAVLTGHLTRTEAEALGVAHIVPDVTQIEEAIRQL